MNTFSMVSNGLEAVGIEHDDDGTYINFVTSKGHINEDKFITEVVIPKGMFRTDVACIDMPLQEYMDPEGD